VGKAPGRPPCERLAAPARRRLAPARGNAHTDTIASREGLEFANQPEALERLAPELREE
jgi:hypothetical protein